VARDVIEPGDVVHWDHVWGVARVLKPGAWAVTVQRPMVVPGVGTGTVTRYAANKVDVFCVDGRGKKWRVPVEHARIVHKNGQGQLF
jgi:hypothetical protein